MPARKIVISDCEDCGRTKYGEPTYKQGLRNFDTQRLTSATNKWNTRDGVYDTYQSAD